MSRIKTKYEIYNAIRTALPDCRSWSDPGIREGVRFTKGQYTFSGSKIDQRFSYSKLDAHFNRVQKPEVPKYSQQSKANLQTAVDGFMSAFAKCFPSSSSGKGSDAINLSVFGSGSLPMPPMDLGIGISAAQLQRQPDETPEQHIARITALINSVTAAMLAHAEEQKRKQRQKQVKQPKIRR